MLAIDTSLIVRYLTGDHPKQAARARQLIDGNEVFVTTAVLLETEWVLRGVYGCEAVALAKALRGFVGLPKVTVEEPAIAARALDWMESGMDFADALQLATAKDCEECVTLDQRFVKSADKIGSLKVRLL